MHLRRPLAIPLFLLVTAAISLGCKSKEADGGGAGTGKAVAKTETPTPEPAPAKAEPIDPENPDWVPKEHVDGIKRFKDPGIYVDGKAIGIIKFGELPVHLKPTWYEEEAPVPFKGDEPRTKIVRQRRYRFVDYFEAMGIDVAKLREVHLWGGTRRHVGVIISGDAFRKYKDFMFRFGSDVYGKPIPHCPTGMASGGCPDNLVALTAYIDKDPPESRDGYFYVDGKKVDGIPYHGPPIRGGVRVYHDGPLAAWIKRHKLEEIKDVKGTNVVEKGGTVRWNLFAVLESQGVDTKKVTEAWLIHRDRHVEQIDRKTLETATFVASPKRGGEILFGDERIRTNAIALHSKSVPASALPKPEAHELHD